MRKAMFAMSSITILFVVLGAFIPYVAGEIQDQICLSQSSIFEAPEINVKLNTSRSLLSNLETFATYDSALEVNGAMKMTDEEVVSSALEYIKKLNEVGFVGDFGKEDDIVTSLYPELCYSSSIGESAFIWSCIIRTKDKSYLADIIIDDASGKVLSISVEQSAKHMPINERDSASSTSTTLDITNKVSEALAGYLNVDLLKVENADDFIDRYFQRLKASLDVKVSKESNTADSESQYDNNWQYNGNAKQEYENGIYNDDYPGLGSREIISTMIEEDFFRIKGSDMYYRIAYSFLQNSDTEIDPTFYWNIVPFYTVQ